MVQVSFVLVFAKGKIDGGELRGFGCVRIVTRALFSPEEAGRSALQKHARLWPVLGEAWLGAALQQRGEDNAHLAVLDTGAHNTFWGWRECNGGRNSRAAVSFLTTD